MDWHTLASKLAPQIVTSTHPVEGEGGIAMPFNLMKERLEFIDVDKCECKSTLIEGGGIGTTIDTATSQMKVKPTANYGSVVKVESTYKLLPGVEVNDEISKAKDSMTAIFKAAEAYLIANPDAYN
ncbi:Pathogenesis-related protein 1 [Hordeum vulgare]|nr:Pathogenesis-related protein 1 [Hordeum vulgare]